MKLHPLFGITAALVLTAAGSARAGFQTLDTDILDQGEVFAYPDPSNAALAITAPASELSSYYLYGTLNSDPDLTITEKILNDSSAPWDSYSITVSPVYPYEVTNLEGDEPPANKTNWLPNSSTSLDGSTVTFSGGLVPVGQTLWAVFDFTITDIGGQFGYNVITSPHEAPEPASLALVGLGAAVLLRRRRSAR